MAGDRLKDVITRCVALVAALALVAGCDGNAVAPSADPSAQASSPPSSTTAGNRVIALAASQHLLIVLRPPKGGHAVDSSPTADLRDPLEGVGPSDSRLSRHAWWTVPMSAQDFGTWLRSQHPDGLTVSDGGSSSAPDGTMVDIAELDGTSTAAYSAPVLTVAYLPHDGGVAVRLDTFLAARYARTTYIPTDTTRVAIRTVTTTFDSKRRTTRHRTVSDPAQVHRLVAAANGLFGTVTIPNIFHCPLMRKQTTATVTFTGPSGTYAITGTATTCAAALALTHDGHLVPPALDPGQRWFPLLGI
ncbi:MAG TPA: hypothetical protein VJ872_01975 [Nocardioides sp.]|nr:hypothetical protein [Nocardioides sp.]